VGRRDEQVKIRGYRIELGNIEARLEQHEGVREAIVVAREDVPGEKRLIAYYTEKVPQRETEEDEGYASAEELRDYLSHSLPEYMVPAGYVRLEKLSLTVNGNVDRKTLPVPEKEVFELRGYELPEGEIETMLAGIWVEVLQVERVGRQDNFFALGGRSLPAVQVAARVQQRLNVELTIRDIFERPTVSLLADQIINLKLNAFDSVELAQLFKEIQP
jgi:acyl carrier protein